MDLLFGVAVVIGLMWLAWRFSPQRRMTRKWSMGEVFHGERTDQNIDLGIAEQRARDIGRDGMGGL